MKVKFNFWFLLFWPLLFFISACCNGEVVNETFTNDELAWLVYNPDSIVTYIDSNGNVDTIQTTSTFVGIDNMYVEGPGCQDYYPAKADYYFLLDTITLSIHLYKTTQGNAMFQKTFAVLDAWGRSDIGPPAVTFTDSLFINNVWQQDVFEVRTDTISYPEKKCTRFYFNKSKGFLRIELRNGINIIRQ